VTVLGAFFNLCFEFQLALELAWAKLQIVQKHKKACLEMLWTSFDAAPRRSSNEHKGWIDADQFQSSIDLCYMQVVCTDGPVTTALTEQRGVGCNLLSRVVFVKGVDGTVLWGAGHRL
jgi:hypothetical protein